MNKIAAVLAFIIGALAVFAGGQVLLGNLPDYYVIDWLPIYNFIIGALSLSLIAVLIWKNSKYALPMVIGIFCAHVIVMLILLVAYGDVVARDSLVAMTLRIFVWLTILILMFFQSRKMRLVTA